MENDLTSMALDLAALGVELENDRKEAREHAGKVDAYFDRISKRNAERRAKEDALIERWKRNTAIDCGARFPADDEQH